MCSTFHWVFAGRRVGLIIRGRFGTLLGGNSKQAERLSTVIAQSLIKLLLIRAARTFLTPSCISRGAAGTTLASLAQNRHITSTAIGIAIEFVYQSANIRVTGIETQV